MGVMKMNRLTDEELLVLIINLGMMTINQVNTPPEIKQRNNTIINKLIVMREEVKSGERTN